MLVDVLSKRSDATAIVPDAAPGTDAASTLTLAYNRTHSESDPGTSRDAD